MPGDQLALSVRLYLRKCRTCEATGDRSFSSNTALKVLREKPVEPIEKVQDGGHNEGQTHSDEEVENVVLVRLQSEASRNRI